MTILLAVGLIPLVSTTVNADIVSDYTYKYYVKDKLGNYHLLLSDAKFQVSTTSSTPESDKYYLYDLNNGDWSVVTAGGISSVVVNKPFPSALILTYTGASWESYLPMWEPYTSSQGMYHFFEYSFIDTYSTSKPSGFPTVSLGLTKNDVQSMINTSINTSLNKTTGITTSAKEIQTEATNAYVDYSNGTLTLAELQATINDLASQLEDLNNSNSATLADKIAVNNAITQTQLVQDAANKDAIIAEMEADLTVSSSVSATITGKINQANQVFTEYSQGSTTQSEAVTQINQYITQLTQLITPQTPTADINAINAAINTINGIKDSVTTHSDLNNDVSESAQLSDQEELEYLEDIEAETTDNIDSLKSKVDTSINESQANEVKDNVITPILQNTLLAKILPIAGLFMVLAVTLGFRYRL